MAEMTEIKPDGELTQEGDKGVDEVEVVDWLHKAFGGEAQEEPKPDEKPEDDKPEAPDEPPVEEPQEPEEKPAPDILAETDFDKKVPIIRKGEVVGYRTVKELQEDGMRQDDFSRARAEVKDEKDKLDEHRDMINIIEKDPTTREYLKGRLDDLRQGKTDPTTYEIPDEIAEQLPWLKGLIETVKKLDAEVATYRTAAGTEQANQRLQAIDNIMVKAQEDIQKSLNAELKPDVFRPRVVEHIKSAFPDDMPEPQKNQLAAEIMLTDKTYFATKAREIYREELDGSNAEKLDEAKKKRAKEAEQARVLSGGGSKPPPQDVKIPKTSDGKVDEKKLIESLYNRPSGEV